MYTRIAAAGFLAVVSLLGCDSREPWTTRDWHGSASFSEAERASIQAGLDLVCENTDRHCAPVVWDLDDYESCRPFIDNEDRDYVAVIRVLSEKSILAYYVAGCVGIRFDVPPRKLFAVAAHEFGHWVGMGHIHGDETGLMSSAAGNEASKVWSVATERECARTHCREESDGYQGER